ncbi:hypothetical protein MferCBS31731_002407 [Microsporum ferrugineum]
MATDDDNFDIDIYGDGSGLIDEGPETTFKTEEPELVLDAPDHHHGGGNGDGSDEKYGNSNNNMGHESHKIFKTEKSPSETLQQMNSLPPPPIQQQQVHFQQGVKRKEADPDATPALYISDLHWWTTDDEIRGWVNQAGAEADLKDVTFSEHKVNGKSKGQAFVEFTSAQAATAAKHRIEEMNNAQQGARKYAVAYTQANINPFKTLPKENPMRGGKDDRTPRPTPPSGFNAGQGNFGMNNAVGFRGNRGGFNNRGGMNQNMGYGNRSFSPMGGGFQGGAVGGFQGAPMGGMQNYGGFNNRGGMMNNMRGAPNMRGRGGMGGMANPMMPVGAPVGGMGAVGGMGGMGGMGGIPMGGMPNQMGNIMGGMQGGNLGMQGQGGFQTQNPHFNPAFFSGGGNDGAWNPHGVKRTRQE